MIIPLMTAEIFGMQILGRLLGVILTAGGIAEYHRGLPDACATLPETIRRAALC